MNFEDRLIKTIKVPIKKNKCIVDKYLIHYVTVGRGMPLLLIHGSNIGWGQWYPNIKKLAQHFKVYAIDLPGAGNSSRINYSKTYIENYLKVVIGFIKIQNLKHVNILGHSFGGFLAIKLILETKKNINKVILVNPMGFTNQIPLRQKIIAISPIVKLLVKTVLKVNIKNINSFLQSAFYKTTILKKEFVDYYVESLKREYSSHPLLFINSFTKGFNIDNKVVFTDNQLLSIKNPVMVIFGEKDKSILLKKVIKKFKLIPAVKVEIFKNVGHVPSLEESNIFNKLVIDFLLKT